MSPMFPAALLGADGSLARSLTLHAVFGPIALLGAIAVVVALVVMVLRVAGEHLTVGERRHRGAGRWQSVLPASSPAHAPRERAA